MKLFLNIFAISALSILVYADEEPFEQSFPGLVSTEIFNMGNGMDLHVERRKTCNQGTVPKHFHPAAGTLVYVLDGVSQSKSTGKWKKYSNNEYWFEKSEWSLFTKKPKLLTDIGWISLFNIFLSLNISGMVYDPKLLKITILCG